MKNFYIKRKTNKRLPQTETLNNHETACDILKLNKIQYFIYTQKTEKNQVILLKDLEGTDFDTEIVFQELANENIENLNFISAKIFSAKNP